MTSERWHPFLCIKIISLSSNFCNTFAKVFSETAEISSHIATFRSLIERGLWGRCQLWTLNSPLVRRSHKTTDLASVQASGDRQNVNSSVDEMFLKWLPRTQTMPCGLWLHLVGKICLPCWSPKPEAVAAKHCRACNIMFGIHCYSLWHRLFFKEKGPNDTHFRNSTPHGHFSSVKRFECNSFGSLDPAAHSNSFACS